MLQLPVYLDYNATTTCDSRVVEAMLPYFSKYFGNADSREHSFGWEAREGVEYAREQVAALIGAEPKEVIFTSGATESDNLAIKGIFESYKLKGNHIITCVTEHKAALDTCRHIEKMGGRVTYLEVDSEGMINLNILEEAITPETILIAIMYANNETGVIHPAKEISAMAKKHGVLFFTDATQAVGKIPVDVQADGIDIMAFSAHKMYGPKGVGALYIRRKNPRVKIAPQMDGGGHEQGIRSGTLNVPAIVGFGKACEIAKQEMEENARRLSALRDKLENALLQLEAVHVNGNRKNRLPHVSNIFFKDVKAAELLTNIKNIAFSSGAACSSASPEPSHVLKALGLEDDIIYSSVRFSLGRFTTEEQVDYTITEVISTVNKLRKENPLWEISKEKVR